MDTNMQRALAARTGALALLVGLTATPVLAATATPDVTLDPKAAWAQLLATGEAQQVYDAYDVPSTLVVEGGGVDAEKCKAGRDALATSLRVAPVSPYLHRIAMLCAEATGDEAGAERELKAVAALAKLALAGHSDAMHAAPIRVLRFHDAIALVQGLGMEWRYAWYERRLVERDYPLVVAAWDPDKKVERHLRFDWTQTAHDLLRKPEQRYPITRQSVVAEMLKVDAKYNEVAAIDQLAIREMFVADGYPAKAAALRRGAEAGGSNAAWHWLALCSEAQAPKDCADGLVDALLVQAEDKHARPMMFLAYAYANGVGVAQDEAGAVRLLDAADQRWSKAGASVAFADLWQALHEDAPMPAWLAARVAKAAALGNEDAMVVQIEDAVRVDPKKPLDARFVAYLESPAQNGSGDGLSLLASNARDRKDTEAAMRYRQRAADAGNPFEQADLGDALLDGDGIAADEAAARTWLERAAHGGNDWAAIRRSYLAMVDGDMLAAQNWALGPAANFNLRAVLMLGEIYATDTPGLAGDSKRAVEMYRLAAPHFAEARRNLAAALVYGKGTEKNFAEARRLALRDAEAGDHESQAMLGSWLLHGMLGDADEREGRKWLEKAIAGGEYDAASDYGYWLVYRKNTPDSRRQGLEVWRKARAGGSTSVDNNFAWALCTAPMDDVRDATAGLEIAKGIRAGQQWGVLDTVAACHAAAGDFAQARALQRDVVGRYRKYVQGMSAARGAKADAEQAKAEADQLKEFEERLALYDAGKPYIEPPNDKE
jgi:TPR repeat protein